MIFASMRNFVAVVNPFALAGFASDARSETDVSTAQNFSRALLATKVIL
jgi:hypothetical protein